MKTPKAYTHQDLAIARDGWRDGWISVKDGLPPPGGFVLIAAKRIQDQVVTGYRFDATWHSDEFSVHQQIYSSDFWMPIPCAPKFANEDAGLIYE